MHRGCAQKKGLASHRLPTVVVLSQTTFFHPDGTIYCPMYLTVAITSNSCSSCFATARNWMPTQQMHTSKQNKTNTNSPTQLLG